MTGVRVVLKILIVDDEPDICELIHKLIDWEELELIKSGSLSSKWHRRYGDHSETEAGYCYYRYSNAGNDGAGND